MKQYTEFQITYAIHGGRGKSTLPSHLRSKPSEFTETVRILGTLGVNEIPSEFLDDFRNQQLDCFGGRFELVKIERIPKEPK